MGSPIVLHWKDHHRGWVLCRSSSSLHHCYLSNSHDTPLPSYTCRGSVTLERGERGGEWEHLLTVKFRAWTAWKLGRVTAIKVSTIHCCFTADLNPVCACPTHAASRHCERPKSFGCAHLVPLQPVCSPALYSALQLLCCSADPHRCPADDQLVGGPDQCQGPPNGTLLPG